MKYSLSRFTADLRALTTYWGLSLKSYLGDIKRIIKRQRIYIQWAVFTFCEWDNMIVTCFSFGPCALGSGARATDSCLSLFSWLMVHVGYYHVYMDRLTSIKLVKYHVQLQQQKTLLHVGSQLLNYDWMFLFLLSWNEVAYTLVEPSTTRNVVSNILKFWLEYSQCVITP